MRAEPERAGGPWGRDERQVALALVYTAVVLTVLEYWWHPVRVEARLRGLPPDWPGPAPSLEAGVLWSLATIAGYAVVPALIVLLVHRQGLGSIGYRIGGFLRHAAWYGGLLLLMLPVVLWVSRREDFQWTYPFVRSATHDAGDFVRWEIAYLAQFFALEAFFRGYLLFTLERRFGRLAVFVMMVPYCMIHYHKPALEACGAILAGLALGALALRFRSWYGGAFLHCAVAFTMDFLAVRQAGLFTGP